METWKSVIGYENNYEISNMGRIRSIDRLVPTGIKYNDKRVAYGKLLKLNLKRNGYYTVDLCLNGKVKTMSIHRIVAKAFLPEDSTRTVVNHKNAIKSDNRVENLEWVTDRENKDHAKANGLYKNKHAKKVLWIEKNIVFDGSYEAAMYLDKIEFKGSKTIQNVACKIRCCANGIQRTAYNYTWKYV